MNSYLIYLFEVSACFALLFLFYKAFLKTLTFYQLRRSYLIAAGLISFIIPSLEINAAEFYSPASSLVNLNNYEVNATPVQTETTKTNVSTTTKKIDLPESGPSHKTQFQLKNLLAGIYFLGMMIMMIRLLFGYARIAKLLFLPHNSEFKNIKVHFYAGKTSAFSFLNHVYINPELFDSEKAYLLALKHESIHVKERHFYDLLLFELFRIVLWFNPVIYFVSKEIKRVHEYIADRKSSAASDKVFYSQMLVQQSGHERSGGLVHSLAHLPLKNRVTEIFRDQSKNITLLRLIMGIPVIALLFFMFSCSNDLESNFALSTNEKSIKSIKVVFHDEYGDMPEYDAKYYSWAKFDRSGYITELKKGTAYFEEEREIEMNNTLYPPFTGDKAIWSLDYHSYDGKVPLFIAPKEYARKRMKNAQKLSGNQHGITSVIISNENDFPDEITFHYHFDKRSIPKTMVTKEIFEYDSDGKLIKLTNVNDNEIEEPTIKALYFEYTPFGKVKKIINDQISCHLSYDENQNISEIRIGNENCTRITYSYDESGLRTKSMAYNTHGELEYRLEYEYEYY